MSTDTTTDQYTRDAVTAIRDAIRAEGDFGGWLASVLATAAAAAAADADEGDQDGPRLPMPALCLVLALRLRRDRIAEQRRTVEHAEQVLAWESDGHLHLPYVTTWHQGTGFHWWETPGYWPAVEESARAASLDPRYSRVVVSLRDQTGQPYVTDWTFAGGELVDRSRRPIHPRKDLAS